MKRILLILIKIYQNIPGSWHNHCRFYPTCSNYCYTAIERFGVIKGIKLSIKRIGRCRPHGKYGYDPVPNKEDL